VRYPRRIERRSLPILTSKRLFTAASLTLFAYMPAASEQPSDVAPQPAPTVRLALVNTPQDVLETLLPGFQEESGVRAEIVYSGQDPFAVAKEGKADLVIAHYGHRGVETFVSGGYGRWPRAVFANQVALIGPSSDPAGVRGMTDAAKAFRQIAAKSKFLTSDNPGSKYIEDILWNAAGRPPKGDWYLDPKLRNRQAVEAAAQRGAYVLWGVPPFLRLKRESPIDLQPLVVHDPLFERIMVSIVVDDAKVSGANASAATRLQEYLLAPTTQAAVRAFRYPELDQQVWWPAGRHNESRE
jgi:tungstate transport system substrate-binding protein